MSVGNVCNLRQCARAREATFSIYFRCPLLLPGTAHCLERVSFFYPRPSLSPSSLFFPFFIPPAGLSRSIDAHRHRWRRKSSPLQRCIHTSDATSRARVYFALGASLFGRRAIFHPPKSAPLLSSISISRSPFFSIHATQLSLALVARGTEKFTGRYQLPTQRRAYTYTTRARRNFFRFLPLSRSKQKKRARLFSVFISVALIAPRTNEEYPTIKNILSFSSALSLSHVLSRDLFLSCTLSLIFTSTRRPIITRSVHRLSLANARFLTHDCARTRQRNVFRLEKNAFFHPIYICIYIICRIVLNLRSIYMYT